MTGDEVRWLRAQLGLTPQQLSDLIGASLSSVYRWESGGPKAIVIDPFQARLLGLLREQFVSREASKQQELAKGIATGLLIGGGLLGLYHLLDSVFGESDRPTRHERRTGGAAARPIRGRTRSSPSKKKGTRR